MFQKFIKFDKMITPSIIKILFWIGLGASVIGGLIMLIGGIAARYGGGIQVLSGLLIIVFGPLFTRVYCELLILFFKINENITEINEKVSVKNGE
ncbi:MAG: DUF4282 domain-containing protein [Halanaerobiales bacterium]